MVKAHSYVPKQVEDVSSNPPLGNDNFPQITKYKVRAKVLIENFTVLSRPRRKKQTLCSNN